jgi:ribosomal protein L37AE/L43A
MSNHLSLIDARDKVINLTREMAEILKSYPEDTYIENWIKHLVSISLDIEKRIKNIDKYFPGSILREKEIIESEGSMNIESLIALADRLDLAGEEEEANKIDEIVQKMAGKKHYTVSKCETCGKDRELANHLVGGEETLMCDECWKHIEKEDSKASTQPIDALQKLATIADKLDEIGAVEEASMIDAFLAKNAISENRYIMHDKEDCLTDKLNVFVNAKDIDKREEAKQTLIEALDDYMKNDRFVGALDDKCAAKKDERVDEYDYRGHREQQVRKPISRKEVKEHSVKPYQETKSHTLSIRHCPNHIGVPLQRVSEGVWQCSLDGEIFCWDTGWTQDGKAVPGGSVAEQTPASSEISSSSRIFDSREKALQNATY